MLQVCYNKIVIDEHSPNKRTKSIWMELLRSFNSSVLFVSVVYTASYFDIIK